MTRPSVRPSRPDAPNGIPADWELIAEWDTPERDRMELYAGSTRGRLLAIRGPYGPEVAAEITAVRQHPRVQWLGTYAARPPGWRNVQAALIRARLSGESPL